MTKDQIDKMADRMADEMRIAFNAEGNDLERSCKAWLMNAIRETEDEARTLAFECANKIGTARKQ